VVGCSAFMVYVVVSMVFVSKVMVSLVVRGSLPISGFINKSALL